MTEFGYALSSEEHPSNDLVRYAQRAEGAGFSFAAISDNFRPWVDQQGQAPFVWSVLGAAKKTAYEWWPNAGIGGELSQELPLPRHFEQAAELVTPDDLAEKLPLGPDPDRHAEAIKAFVDAGYDHVYIHQIGPDQDGFFDFFERELHRRL